MSDGYSDYTYNYQNPYAAYRPQVQQQQQGPSAGQQVAGQAARTGAGVAGRSIASSLAGGGTAAAGGAAATGGAAAGGGTIIVANAAAVPAGYTAIGSAAGGGIVAAPTATIAGTGAATTGAAGASGAGAAAAGGSGAAGAGSAAALAGGIGAGALTAGVGGYLVHDLMSRGASQDKAKSGAAQGYGAGMALGGPIGGLIGGAAGYARDMFGSGKSKAERERDSYRGLLQEVGFFDEDWNRTTDVGTWKAGDSNQEGRDDFNWNLEVDEQGNLSNEEQRMMAGSLDPLTFIFAQGNDRQQGQMTGEVTNAILTTGGGQQEVKDLYASMGLNRETAVAQLNALLEEEKLDEGKFNAYLAAIDRTLD